MKTAFLLLCACAAALAVNPMTALRTMSPETRANNVWAVLVAGSNTYSNYRHQSDICAMYQQLHNMGIPDSRIIVLMYDDIAKSVQNPRPGVIINTPDGPDVYKGVPKDYTGNLVTAKNFLRILQGGAPFGGSGKKLKSTSNDHVFVFFSDHGGLDILAFPTGDYLYSQDLHTTITSMSEKKMFGTLYVTIEACEAGSMFYQYEFPENVFITTASPIAESSYAWQWDDSVGAYVSDVWSWYMLDYLVQGNEEKTLQDQFDYVNKAMNNYSQPCEYGDLEVGKDITIGEFFGTAAKSNKMAKYSDAVRAWDASLEAARRLHSKHNTEATAATLRKEERAHQAIDALKARLVSAVGLNGLKKQPAQCTENNNKQVGACARELANEFRSACGNKHDYLDSATTAIWAMCHANVDVTAALSAIRAECSKFSL